jgi:hypothetical protein
MMDLKLQNVSFKSIAVVLKKILLCNFIFIYFSIDNLNNFYFKILFFYFIFLKSFFGYQNVGEILPQKKTLYSNCSTLAAATHHVC